MTNLIRKAIRHFWKRPVIGKNNVIENLSGYRIKKMISGNHNRITAGKNCVLKRVEFWIEGDHNTIDIGAGTTVEQAHIACVGYDGFKVVIGRDCMFSSGVRIVNTDSHSILSLETGKRINPEQDVVIGDHVWLGMNVTVLKGVTIGNDAVVAAGSVVTGNVAPNCVYGGIPARCLSENITWDRKRL